MDIRFFGGGHKCSKIKLWWWLYKYIKNIFNDVDFQWCCFNDELMMLTTSLMGLWSIHITSNLLSTLNRVVLRLMFKSFFQHIYYKYIFLFCDLPFVFLCSFYFMVGSLCILKFLVPGYYGYFFCILYFQVLYF